MKIAELEPKVIVTKTLSMLCPICKQHKITVLIGDNGWRWDGVTLVPSIQFEGGFTNEKNEPVQCKGHFRITGGTVIIL